MSAPRRKPCPPQRSAHTCVYSNLHSSWRNFCVLIVQRPAAFSRIVSDRIYVYLVWWCTNHNTSDSLSSHTHSYQEVCAFCLDDIMVNPWVGRCRHPYQSHRCRHHTSAIRLAKPRVLIIKTRLNFAYHRRPRSMRVSRVQARSLRALRGIRGG